MTSMRQFCATAANIATGSFAGSSAGTCAAGTIGPAINAALCVPARYHPASCVATADGSLKARVNGGNPIPGIATAGLHETADRKPPHARPHGVLEKSFAFILALSLPAYLPLEARAQPASTDKTLMVLFDSSGSMWGNLQGSRNPKFEIAREALRSALDANAAEANAALKSGLVVFGRSCSVADVSTQPQAQSSSALLAPLDRLNPKGKGPITLALARAAQVLPPDAQSTIILIHDGPDNCNADPCAQAAELARSHPKLTAHLVSIGIDDAELPKTSCIADSLRGSVFAASDATGLDDAVGQAVKLAMLDKPPATAKKPPPETEDRSAKPANEDETGPPRLMLSATLGNAGTPIDGAVRWQIRKTGEAQSSPPLLDVAEARFTVPLQPGTYQIDARYGLATASSEVTIAKEGATRRAIAFDAGAIQLGDAGTAGSAAAASGTVDATLITVSPAAQGSANDAGAPIALRSGANRELILPSGEYWITAQRGSARDVTKVSVEAGSRQKISPLSRYGTVDIAVAGLQTRQTSERAVPTDGNVVITIYVDDPDNPSGRREVRRSASPSASFLLPAGTYYVNARAGSANAQKLIAVGAGGRVDAKLDLDVANLRVTTSVDPAVAGSGLEVLYRVSRRLGDIETPIAWSGARAPLFQLPPGRYTVTAEVGARNVTASQTLDLSSGAELDLDLTANAAHLSLELDGAKAGRFADRFWEIRSAAGDIIWRTNRYAPTAILAPGRYLVRCETRGGVFETTFALETGERRTIALNTD